MKAKFLPYAFCILCLLPTAYCLSQGTWTQKASLPTNAVKRAETGSFSINGKGYVFGGSDVYPNWLSDCWEYDPILDSWAQKASISLVGPRESAFFTIGNLGYAATGFYGSGASSAVSKNFFVFDPAANTWTKKKDFGGTARRDAVGFSIGTKGYVGTGADAAGQTADLWEYDPSGDTWTKKSNFLGAARNAATSFAIGTKGYISLGRNGATTFNDFWEYDPGAAAGGVWTQKANFPGVTRSESSSFVIGTVGYVGSGHNAAAPDFWAFDQVANSWSAIAPLPGTVERNEAVGFAIGAKGYIAQGNVSGSGAQKDLWEYVPATTGVDEVNNALAFSVSPNPSAGKFQIIFEGGNYDYAMSVFSLQGEKVYTRNTQDGTALIDISSQPSGIYFIQVRSNDGRKTLEGIQKIIVQR